MQNVVKKSWMFSQPPQEVWEYLTNPQLIEQWMMKSDFKPVVGHKFRFTHTPKNESQYQGVTVCEVLEVSPVTRLSYTWQGKTNSERVFDSKVIWTLIPRGSGTELQLQHDGFTLLEDFTAHNNGWDTCKKRLDGLLNMVSQ